MSSYFDETDTKIRNAFEAHDPGYTGSDNDVRWAEFWKRYRPIETQLIEDCLKATRARKFPPHLKTKIELVIWRRRIFRTSRASSMNEREAQALLSMRMSFLSSELHSLFHEVATWGNKHGIRHLTDSPAWMAKRAPKEPT